METLHIILFAAALNFDVFVLSLYVGTKVTNPQVIPFMSVIIGICQSLVPLVGYIIGNVLGKALGEMSTRIGALLLVFVGIQLIRESYCIAPKQIGQNLILAYLGVGLEDLMAGVSMGTFSRNPTLFIFLFFLMSIVSNFIALNIGRKIQSNKRLRAELITGVILLIMGVISYLESINALAG